MIAGKLARERDLLEEKKRDIELKMRDKKR